jgi:hypothetical protein
MAIKPVLFRCAIATEEETIDTVAEVINLRRDKPFFMGDFSSENRATLFYS